MVPALLDTRSPFLSRHSLLGCSTGYMEQDRGDWLMLVQVAAGVSSLAVEISAISEPELDGLLDYLRQAPRLPFRYVSVHGPSKDRALSEPDLVQQLAALPAWVDAIVMHPDTFEDPAAYLPLGRRLLLENMDARKHDARTADELDRYFQELPDAGLCFDVAHAKSVDESMGEGGMILDRYGNRLRHVHLSSLDTECHHVSLTVEDQRLFWPLLERCRDVPWILEAPPTP
jgi:sugar phosphate isomerase/epimerase